MKMPYRKKCPKFAGKTYRIRKIISDNGNYFSNKTLDEIKATIETFVDDLIWLYENVYGPKEGMSEDSKMIYHEELNDEEKLLGYLKYMADRWKCSIRIRLMIDIVRPNYVAKNRKKDFILPYSFKK